jgi:hypothetical protein
MFSIKRLAVLGYTVAFVGGSAHAQSRPFVPNAQPASAHVPAADLDLGDDAGAKVASTPAAATSQPPAQPPVAGAPDTGASRLSIDDADNATRSQLLRQLVGAGAPAAPANPVPATSPAPAPVTTHKAVAERTRAEPVRFVGAFSDVSGTSVLYEYRGASYPAHVGTKLLNGWTATRVDGFVVTVTEGTGKGARTWTETIVGGTPPEAQAQTVSATGIRRLTDLGAPLPPGTPISAIAQ